MKIAMLFAHWMDFGEPWSTPISWVNRFREDGHDVYIFNLYHDNGRLNPRRKIREYSENELVQLYWRIQKGEKFDVVYILDYGPFQSLKLTPNNFPGAVLIKECGDEPQSHAMHSQTARQFHICLSPDKESVDHYRANGINAYWQTHFADEKIFKPYPEIKTEFDCVTTCGPRGHGLTEKIKSVLGNRFNNERYFFGVDHAKRLNMGKIVFQKSQHGEITRRIFEGMACGKMVLTDRLSPTTGLSDLFIDGKDIVYYDNADDAIDKINFYASNDAARNSIATSGFHKTMTMHTSRARVNELYELIKQHDQFKA